MLRSEFTFDPSNSPTAYPADMHIGSKKLSASHGDVVRQLQAIGDGLRQELAQRQGGDVSVQVAQQQARGDADGRQRQGEQRQQQPGRALDEQPEADQRFALAADRS